MITEKVKSFKIPISRKQAGAVNENTTKARVEIYKGQLTYSAIVNDTCAETAKEILDDSDIETPNGFSWIKHSNIADIPIAYAVNPYKWHKEFKAKYQEIVFHSDRHWIPLIGNIDPIYENPSLAKSEQTT